MKARTKKRLSYFTIGIFFLLGGIEYAVILPTLWQYLEDTFNGEPYLLGVVLSAFFCAGLFSGPLMGWWSDRSQNTKLIIFISTLFEAAGSFMYFLGLSPWFLVLSRFIAGLGTGVGSAIVADLTRVTSGQTRTSVISSFFAVRNIGILIGPACNLFLRQLDFYIGPFVVNKFTAPGLFMTILWLIMAVIVAVLYTNLPQLHKQMLEEETTAASSSAATVESNERQSLLPSNRQPVTNGNANRPPLISGSFIDDGSSGLLNSSSYSPLHQSALFPADLANGTMRRGSNIGPSLQIRVGSEIITSDSAIQQGYDILSDSDSRPKPAKPDNVSSAPTPAVTNINVWSWSFFYNEYILEEVVIIFASSFVTSFNQISMETMVTPLGQKLLGWGDIENSILFLVSAIELLLVFLVVTALSRCLHDRSILLIGFVVTFVTVAFLTWFIPQATPGNNLNLPGFIVAVFFDLLGMPFLASATASLLSKMTSEPTQGFTQGVKGVFDGVANILAPLWVGGTLTMPYVMFGVMDAIMAIVLVMMIVSFKYLKPEAYHGVNKSSAPARSSAMPDDERALLGESA